jgi:hypothetical protein
MTLGLPAEWAFDLTTLALIQDHSAPSHEQLGS